MVCRACSKHALVWVAPGSQCLEHLKCPLDLQSCICFILICDPQLSTANWLDVQAVGSRAYTRAGVTPQVPMYAESVQMSSHTCLSMATAPAPAERGPRAGAAGL